MFNNPYMTNNFAQQNMMERIDSQISQLQNMREQVKNNPINQNHQPAINQTFQLAPNGNGGIRYVNSIDDVLKESVFVDTPYFSKDLSVLWIKKTNGEIKAYELNEIVKKDEKDILISSLQIQIEELRKELKNNAKPNNDNDVKSDKDETTTNVSVPRTSTKKSK